MVAGLSFGQADLYTQSNRLTRPTTVSDVFTPYGYFGPDFMVTTTSTVAPEPGSVGMLLLGLPILARGRFRVRKTIAAFD